MKFNWLFKKKINISNLVNSSDEINTDVYEITKHAKEIREEVEKKNHVIDKKKDHGIEHNINHHLKTNLKSKFRQIITAIVVNLLSFGFGTVNGWTSPAQSMLQSSQPPIGDRPMTNEEISWLGSISFMGGIVGTLIYSRVPDRFGRKMAGYLVAVPFIASWLMMVFATNFLSLVIARFIAGMGCLGSFIIVPLVVSEMADDNLRGPLGSSLVLLMNCGLSLSYIVGAFATFTELNTVCLLVPVIFIFLFYWIPESPTFLTNQNRLEEAKESLIWFRGGDQKLAEREMKLLINEADNRLRVTLGALFSDPVTFKGFRILFVLIMGQQITAINIVQAYTATIFKKAGSTLEPNICTIIVGIIQLSASVLSCSVINAAGRKVLLLITFFGVALSLAALGVFYYFLCIGADTSSFSFVPVVALSVHVICVSLGVGPVPFVLFGELLPPYIRSLATSICFMFGIFGAFLTVKVFPFLNSILGEHGTFLFYALCSSSVFVYTIFFVPETKGKSVQQILNDLRGNDSSFEKSKSASHINSEFSSTVILSPS